MARKTKDMSIRRMLIISFVVIAFTLMSLLTGLWIYTEITRTNREKDMVIETTLAKQKDKLKERVENVLALIRTMRIECDEQPVELIQESILQWLASLRFEYGGYYFVNKPDGTALVFDGERVDGQMNILDMKDPNGKRLFDIEIEAYLSDNGRFMTYLFKRINTDNPEPKISYMKGFRDWNWIIGAGNYVEDYSAEIDRMNSELRQNLRSKILRIGGVFIFFSILLVLFAHFGANLINNQIRKLNKYLKLLLNNSEEATKENYLVKEFNTFADTFSSLISGKNQAEMELAEALKKAEQSANLKTAFVNNISHEVRTPLNAIVGFSNLLFENDLDPEKKKQYIEIINESADHLLNMLNEILYISKHESSDGILLTLSEFALPDLLMDVRNLFDPQCLLKGINIISIENPESTENMLVTDRGKLLQIMNSLVSNAIKFTHTGRIKIGFEMSSQACLFFVDDSGIGIPEEEHEKIFDRFYQVDHSLQKNYRGVGLGLNITRKLVEMLGGKIWVKSKPGEGSTFYFTIPLKDLPDIEN